MSCRKIRSRPPQPSITKAEGVTVDKNAFYNNKTSARFKDEQTYCLFDGGLLLYLSPVRIGR